MDAARPDVHNALFVCCVTVTDPETADEVEIEVWKDPKTGGIFALDSSFLDQVSEIIDSPFDPSGPRLRLPEDLVTRGDGQRGRDTL